MPTIPLPSGYKGTENLPRTNEILQNCFNDGDGHIISRRGIAELADTGKIARGQFEWNGSLYQVVSNDLIKITDTETGAFSVIGTIAGPDPIQTAVGFNHEGIVVPGGAIYSLSTSDTLTDISANANFEACVDITHMNDRFIFTPSDGGPIFFSDIGAIGTVQAASFFDAGSVQDKNKATFLLSNSLYVMGTDTIQPFQDTGADPNPFFPIQGGLIRAGYIGGLLEYDKTFLFIGRKKDQAAGIFAIGAGEAIKISNPRIDKILFSYSDGLLAEAIPGRVNWGGHDIATFALRNDSFGFFKGEWFLLDTVLDNVSRTWGGGFITEFEGDYWTAYNSKIGKFQQINTDYGERVTRRAGMGVYQNEGEFTTIQSLEVGVSQGFNSAQGSVALRMSRDNVTWGPFMYINLGKIGEYTKTLKWNPTGGLGNYRGFFAYELYTTEDIDFSIDRIIMDGR